MFQDIVRGVGAAHGGNCICLGGPNKDCKSPREHCVEKQSNIIGTRLGAPSYREIKQQGPLLYGFGVKVYMCTGLNLLADVPALFEILIEYIQRNLLRCVDLIFLRELQPTDKLLRFRVPPWWSKDGAPTDGTLVRVRRGTIIHFQHFINTPHTNCVSTSNQPVGVVNQGVRGMSPQMDWTYV